MNKDYYKIICLFLAIHFLAIKGICQQSPLYAQYMFNGLIINPAYAGSHEAMDLTGLFRKQWIGLEGGPSTQNLIAHAPLTNNKIALGVILSNDYIGAYNQNGVDGIYAYRISLSEKRKISFGLQTGFSRFSIQSTNVLVKDPNDPSFGMNKNAYSSLYFGAGIYYSSENFYIGLSSPRFQRIDFNNSFFNDRSRNYFLTSGYVFKVSPHFKVMPSTLVKMYQLIPQVDINGTLMYEDVFWIGLSYRTFTAITFIAKVQLTDQLSLGYSYDNTINKLKAITKGGHEFVLSYNFVFFKSNVVTPRDF